MCEKIYIWNPSTCTCKNGRYLGSIIGDSVIMCDEITEVTKTIPTYTIPKKTIPTSFNNKRLTVK